MIMVLTSNWKNTKKIVRYKEMINYTTLSLFVYCFYWIKLNNSCVVLSINHSFLPLKKDSSCLDCPDQKRFATFFVGIQNFTFHPGSTAKSSRFDNTTLADEDIIDNRHHNDNEKNMLIDEYHEKIIRLLNAKYNNFNTRYRFEYF